MWAYKVLTRDREHTHWRMTNGYQSHMIIQVLLLSNHHIPITGIVIVTILADYLTK